MSFKDLHGQPLVLKLLERWFRSGHLTGPLLFYGPESVGKRKAARELAKILLCAENTEGQISRFDSCGRCAPCQKIDAETFPDLTIINLATQAAWRNEPLEKQLSLRLDTIQDARKILWKTPQQSHSKVMILEDIHLMTPDAANVLLKTLEEPPADAMIVLLTPFRDRILSTILSRCQAIRFRSLTKAERRRLHLNDPERVSEREEAESLWEKRKNYSRAQMLKHSEVVSSHHKKGAALDKWMSMMLEDATEAIREGDFSSLRDAERLLKASRSVRHRVTPGLVLDTLLLDLRKPS